MQNYRFELDVTQLVNRVKEQGLLFYPVMIHILLQAARENILLTAHEIVPLWNFDDGENGINQLHEKWEGDFNDFYRKYIYACFNCQNENDPPNQLALPENAVAIFYQPITDFSQLNLKLPHFQLLNMVQIDKSTILPILMHFQGRGFDFEQLKTKLQKLCDSF